MTADRDLDRRIDIWLDLMPSEAPDRVIDAVLLAAETTPQVRRRLLRGPRRPTTMTRFTLIAAAAVLGTVIVGSVLLTAGGRPTTPDPAVPPPTASATETATTTPSSTAQAVAIDDALQYRWIGTPRDIAGRGETSRTALNFTPDAFYVTGTSYGYGTTFLTSAASIDADGRLRLETTAPGRVCDEGAVGTYPWSLSPGGTVLTVEPGDDSCADRASAMPGTWYRVACKNIASACWGVLEAGTYPTQYIDPRRDPGDTWAPPLGAMTFTVPDGWANSQDWPNEFVLTPAADYATEDEFGSKPDSFHELDILAHPAPVLEECRAGEDAAADRSVDGIVAYLQRRGDLTVTDPQPVTIGGFGGQQVDVRLRSKRHGACNGTLSGGAVDVLTAAGEGDNDYVIGLSEFERWRLALLDLGGRDVVAILLDSSDATRFDDLVVAAEPIIESLQFK